MPTIGIVYRVRSEAQIIEIFHLLFLRVLASGRPDWFTLKGGANLRYFFASPRYSNDIDLDFAGRKGWQVAEKVGSVLDGGRPLATLAQSVGIGIVEVTSPKQTDTTLRWKVGLADPDHHHPIRTKVEFSGRPGDSDDVGFDVVPDRIVGPYGLQSPTVRHYRAGAAIGQKIAALALRSETKARDIFDLELLFRQRRAAGLGVGGIDVTHARDAAGRALDIPFPNFMTEVAPFLDPDIAALYDAAAWNAMCLDVASRLDEIAATGQSGGAP